MSWLCTTLAYYYIFLDCGPRQNPSDGAVTLVTGMTTYGSEAQFSCNTGFTVSEPSKITCQANATWSSADPTCTKNGMLHLYHFI